MKISKVFKSTVSANVKLPYYTTKVQAGFPSPADDHMSSKLDLNKHLVKRPSSTFFVRVTGDSMIDAGIKENDLLIVDRSLEASSGRIVIAVVGGEFTVKRLQLNLDGDSYLIAENKNYSPIKLDDDAYIWGVVTGVVREF